MRLLARVDKIPQAQTYRFNWAVAEAMEKALGRPIDILATVPVRDWPFSRKIWFAGKSRKGAGTSNYPATRKAKSERHERNSHAVSAFRLSLSALFVQMPLLNLLGFKQFSRFLTAAYYVAAWVRRPENRGGVILCYGVIVPHLLAARWAAGRWAKVATILTDAPLNYADEPWLYRAARWLDRRLLAWVMSRLDGVVALTPGLARRLAPGKPALIMEGIVSEDVEQYISGKWKVENRDERRSPQLHFPPTIFH